MLKTELMLEKDLINDKLNYFFLWKKSVNR